MQDHIKKRFVTPIVHADHKETTGTCNVLGVANACCFVPRGLSQRKVTNVLCPFAVLRQHHTILIAQMRRQIFRQTNQIANGNFIDRGQ